MPSARSSDRNSPPSSMGSVPVLQSSIQSSNSPNSSGRVASCASPNPACPRHEISHLESGESVSRGHVGHHHPKPEIRLTGVQIEPAAVGAADILGAVVPASAPDEMIAFVFERRFTTRVGPGMIGNPFIGVADHIHTPIRAGSIGVASYGSALVRFVRAGGRMVIFGVIALFRIPGVAPRVDE